MLDFPQSPTHNQTANGRKYNSTRGVWEKIRGIRTADSFNRIVNPAFQHSQQNLDVAGTTNGYYLADQWYLGLVAPIGSYQAHRVIWSTAEKSKYRGRIYVAAANTTPAVGDYLAFVQLIEGLRIADLELGTANARQLVFRFSFYSSIAGTFTVSIRNGAGDRSFLAPFTVPGGTHTAHSFVIPGDTAGTWPKDNTRGMQVWVTVAAGTTYQGAPGWNIANKLSITGSTNLYSTGGAIVELSDVGLYADPYKTGRIPQYEAPDDQMELLTCQRYWYRAYVLKGFCSSATGATRMSMAHPVPMRIAPTSAFVGACRAYDGTAAPAMSTIATNVSTIDVAEFNMTSVTGLTAGRACIMPQDGVDIYVAMSARP